MDQELQQSTNDITIPKKVLGAFIAGTAFTLIVVVIVLKVLPVPNQNLISDNQDRNIDYLQKTITPIITKSVASTITGFIQGYPNYGQYNGLPSGPWINLENNTIPSLKSNVVIIAHIVHYQKYTLNTLPVLQDIYMKNKNNDTVVIGINNKYIGAVDETDYVKVKKTLNDKGVTFPVVIDQNNKSLKYAADFENIGYPGIIIVDKFGNVRYMHDGAGNFDKLYNAIETMQQQTKPSPPSIASLIENNKTAILDYIGADSTSIIKAVSLNKIENSPFYIISLTIYNSSGGQKYGFVVIGQNNNQQWIVGIPFDNNYCTMLNQANLSHNRSKQFEMLKCRSEN